ncbi:MAG TPA: DNA-binding response regulator, partial [Clostridiales bacterium]|nr:DNA-binding response regulator [Clostridiales bacterium]
MQKILIIDDDQNICEALKIYLENEKFEVKIAHEGSVGLTAC